MPKRIKTGGRTASLSPPWSVQLQPDIAREIKQLAADLNVSNAEVLRGCLAYLWQKLDYHQLKEVLKDTLEIPE